MRSYQTLGFLAIVVNAGGYFLYELDQISKEFYQFVLGMSGLYLLYLIMLLLADLVEKK